MDRKMCWMLDRVSYTKKPTMASCLPGSVQGKLELDLEEGRSFVLHLKVNCLVMPVGCWTCGKDVEFFPRTMTIYSQMQMLVEGVDVY